MSDFPLVSLGQGDPRRDLRPLDIARKGLAASISTACQARIDWLSFAGEAMLVGLRRVDCAAWTPPSRSSERKRPSCGAWARCSASSAASHGRGN